MKLTKKQLKNLIKEEKRKLLNEMLGDLESLSPLIGFAQAWAGLGNIVQEQIIEVINGYFENNEEAVYEINPNALDVAIDRLSHSLNALRGSSEAEEIMGALDWAQELIQREEGL